MAKISLAKSFVLRKRLRSIINTISGDLNENGAVSYLTSKVFPDGSTLKSSSGPYCYKGLDLSGTYKLLQDALEKMTVLNNLIDEANVISARKIINELEEEKAKVAILTLFATQKKNFRAEKDAYESTYSFKNNDEQKVSGIATSYYTLSNDDNWEKAASDCSKKIRILEDKLSDANGETYFEVPDNIVSFIEENV